MYSSMSSLAFFHRYSPVPDHQLVRAVYGVPGTLAYKRARPGTTCAYPRFVCGLIRTDL